MSEPSVRDFYDELAHDYHLMFRDWDAGTVLDCSCGIGTQAIGWTWPGTRSSAAT
jgi:hypothetical protein